MHAAKVVRRRFAPVQGGTRIQEAFDSLWMYTDELFESDTIEENLEKKNLGVASSTLKKDWDQKIKEVFSQAGLEIPSITKHSMGYGKNGIHTEYLGYLLAEMQHLNLLYPDAKW